MSNTNFAEPPRENWPWVSYDTSNYFAKAIDLRDSKSV